MILLSACGGGGGDGDASPSPAPGCIDPCGVTISWSRSPEAAVSSAGGGYRVYLATATGAALAEATLITVPFDPLVGTTPTSSALRLTAGTWFVRVTSFSALNPTGSAPSQELVVVVP